MQLLVTSYAQSTFKLQHSPSALPSHFQLRTNCARCHYEFSYLHLDSVWLLFAVEIKGVWFSKVCMQSRQLFLLMLYSWHKQVSSFSIYVGSVGRTNKDVFIARTFFSSSTFQKILLQFSKHLWPYVKLAYFQRSAKKYNCFLYHMLNWLSIFLQPLRQTCFWK